MSARRMGFLVIVLVVASLFCASQATAPAGKHSAPVTMRLPLSFEPNVGQADRSVQFVTHAGASTVLLTGDGATVRLIAPPNAAASDGADVPRLRQKNLRSAEVRFRLRGAQQSQGEGLGLQPHTSNYFIGQDAAKWRQHVPHFARVRYRDIYPGIDLVYYGNPQRLEYDFVVAPGADPRRIAFAIDGGRVSLEGSGDLVIQSDSAQVRYHKPLVYQDIHGDRREIAGHYVLRANGDIAFQVSAYDRTKPLTIDPTLVFSTFFGGSNFENLGPSTTPRGGVAAGANGYAYISGYTASTDLPTLGGVQPACSTCSPDQTAVFVAAFQPDGTMLYSTYLGGTNGATLPAARAGGAGGIAVDAAGSAYITGTTSATDFPTTLGAFQVCVTNRQCNGRPTAFVTKLAPDGTLLLPAAYSTYLGSPTNGGQDEVRWNIKVDSEGWDIKVDSEGSAYVVGLTDASDFPVTDGAFQTDPGFCCRKVFVTKLDPSGTSLLYSTFLHGSPSPWSGINSLRIALDASGSAYVAGSPMATPDFPTQPPQPVPNGGAFKSTDGGAHWTRLNLPSDDRLVSAIAVQPGGYPVFVGTIDHGLFFSPNGGDDWQGAAFFVVGGSGFSTTDVGRVNAVATGPTPCVFAVVAGPGVVSGGLYRSSCPGEGLTFHQVGGNLGQVRNILIPPWPNYVYVVTSNGRIQVSMDFGDTWSLMLGGPSGVNVLASDPVTGVLYAGTDHGVFKTDSAPAGPGALWTFPNALSSENVTCLAPGPPDPNQGGMSSLYACTLDGPYKSTDGGTAWTSVGGASFDQLLATFQITGLVADPSAPGTVYGFTPANGIFKTTDSGTIWLPFNNGQDLTTTALAMDLSSPLTLYVGTKFSSSFVAKLAPDGTSLVYSTLLAGNGIINLSGLAVDSAGSAYITGHTTSQNFATPGAYQTAMRGLSQAFVSKLTPDGSGWVYSTLLGGSTSQRGFGIAVDSQGLAYVAGRTHSLDFPLVNPIYEANPTWAANILSSGNWNGSFNPNGFVAQLNSTGTSLLFSTYLPGSSSVWPTDLALAPNHVAYVTGGTDSSDFPTPNAFQPDLSGPSDAFLTAIQFDNTPPSSPPNTPVSVQPADSSTGTSPVSVTFSNVTEGGNTTLTTSSDGPAPPAGFSLGSPATYYNIQTNALFTGSIQICIDYSGVTFIGDPITLVIMHFEGQSWTPLETLLGTQPNTVCANTTSLSPFAVMQQTNRAPVANAGPPQAVQCTSAAGAAVALDGTGSFDPDQDTLSYAWTGPFGSATGATPTVNLPLGPSTITLVVNDGRLSSLPSTVRDTVTIGVAGLQPPLAGLVLSGNSPQAPANALKQGRTLPLKLQLSCGSTVIASGVAPPQIVAIIRNGDALDLTTIDPDAGQANDNGLLFRSDGSGNWAYNLSTAGLGTGTYTITIQMPDGQRYDAAFVLR